MPIVINEYDKTKAAASEYANFAVVVLGAAQENATGFDDNGIYECSSQADFIKNIGLTKLASFSTGKTIGARPCTAAEISKDGIEGDYYTIIKGTEVYERVDAPAGTDAVGRLISYDESAKKYYKYNYLFTSDGHGLFVKKDETYYTVSDLGQDAQNPTENDTQMGNQIAYELLGLGYTVYYKNISKIDSTDGNNKKIVIDTTALTDLSALEDKVNYDFRYIISGFLDTPAEVQAAIANLAGTRGDCVALLDVNNSSYKAATNQADRIEAIKTYVNSISMSKSNYAKYCAFFAPAVTYSLSRSTDYENAYGHNYKFPASFHYLSCVALASDRYAEWYAASGYTRGISDFSIASTDITLGEAAIKKLQPRNSDGGLERAVNVIAKFRNQYLLWGNRTAHKLSPSASTDGDLIASDFLNIRQLCCTLKKQIYVACRQLTFDPNSDILWFNFKNKVRPILEKMKTDQGIKDYAFEKVATDQKATLKARVRIVPIEAVEDFRIDVTLEDSLEEATIVDTEVSDNE